jgi:DNA-binding FrmR family transcriptional regulator
MTNDSTKRKVLARLRRVIGQLEGVARMIEDDRYCVDVLHQIASARAALGQAAKVVLHSHVVICLGEAMRSGELKERERKVGELIAIFVRYGGLGRT